jgi:hypothetical protein
VLFDCHACHRRMDGGKWAPRQGTGLGPGVVRLNDSNLVMFRHVLAVVDRGASQRLLEQTRELHRATTVSRDATGAAARRLRDNLQSALPQVAGFDFAAASLGPILDSLLADADRGEFRDFAAAEQAAMAAASVIVAFETAKALEPAQVDALKAKVDVVYSKVDNENAYDMGAFVASLRELRRAAG